MALIDGSGVSANPKFHIIPKILNNGILSSKKTMISKVAGNIWSWPAHHPKAITFMGWGLWPRIHHHYGYGNRVLSIARPSLNSYYPCLSESIQVEKYYTYSLHL